MCLGWKSINGGRACWGRTHCLLIVLTLPSSASCSLEECPFPLISYYNFYGFQKQYLPFRFPPPFQKYFLLIPKKNIFTKQQTSRLEFLYPFIPHSKHLVSIRILFTLLFRPFHWGGGKPRDCLSKSGGLIKITTSPAIPILARLAPPPPHLPTPNSRTYTPSPWDPTFMPGYIFCVTFNCSSRLSIPSSWFTPLSFPATG